MSHLRVSATSRAATEADEQRRALAWELLKASSAPVVDFAKLMVPTSLTSVGVILALGKDAGLLTSGASRVLTVVGCGLCLAAMLIFARAAYARPLRISEHDYAGVIDEVLGAARARQRTTTAGMITLTAGVVAAIIAHFE